MLSPLQCTSCCLATSYQKPHAQSILGDRNSPTNGITFVISIGLKKLAALKLSNRHTSLMNFVNITCHGPLFGSCQKYSVVIRLNPVDKGKEVENY